MTQKEELSYYAWLFTKLFFLRKHLKILMANVQIKEYHKK